jgi:PKD repeat protein
MKKINFIVLKSATSFVKWTKHILFFLLLSAVVYNFKNVVKGDKVISTNFTKAKVISPTPTIKKEVNSIRALSLCSNPITKLIENDKEEYAGATGTDSAWFQNFKMTSDPTLGYPPYERMKVVRDLIDNNQSSGNKAIQGMNWYERGSNSCSGRTRAIMWDPTIVNRVWAGGANGGLWYTDNIIYDSPSSGNSPTYQWNNVTDIWSNLAISCITYDNISAIANRKYYVGTGEGFGSYNSGTGIVNPHGGGIWESSNGINWTVIPATEPGGMYNFSYIQKIAFSGNGSNNSDMYVGTFHNGLMKRDQAGTWSKVLGSGSGFFAISDQVADIETGYGPTYKLYAALGLTAKDGIYGLNQSNAWVNLTQGNGFPANFSRICLATDPEPLNASNIWALVQTGSSNQDLKLYKSTNEGGTWVNIPFGVVNNINSQIGYNMSLGVMTGGNVIYVGGVGQIASTDGGSSWIQISTAFVGMHADQHDVAFLGNEAILCNDGGLYYSSDASMSTGGISIFPKREGYNVSQLYSSAIKNVANDPYYIFGSQDNGTQIATNTGVISATNQSIKGDGGYCFVDQDQPNIQIGSTQGVTSFQYSTNSGLSFTPFDYTSLWGYEDCYFIMPADYDSRENILIHPSTEGTSNGNTDCLSKELIKFSNVGGGGPVPGILANKRNIITVIYPVTLGSTVTAITVLPNNQIVNASTVFVGTNHGKLYKVPNIPNNGLNATVNAIDLFSPLFGQNVSVSSIEIGNNEDQILVTFSNFGISSVWETKDGGLTWEDKDAPTQPNPSLPDMPIYWALYNPNNTNEVLLATEAGIWSTDNINELPYPAWGFDINANCPKTAIYMLKYRSADNVVVAATHGRGMWASEIFKHPVASFTVTQSQPCPGLAVSFTNTSTVNPTSFLWDFGDGNTSTLANPFHYYALPGLYTCKLTVTNAFGSSSYTQQINASLDCCAGDVEILDGRNASDYINDFNGGATNFIVNGKFYIDVNGLSLTGINFIAKPGAEIIVNDGITFYATNCNFYACSDMWQGISVRNESKLVFENCVIKDANTGVAPNFQASFDLTNCHFENNIYGVYASIDFGYPAKEGSFGIIGCTFNFNTTLKLPYFGQTAFGIKPKAGVYMRFRHGIIGNNYLAANSFTDLNTGIILKNSSITLINASFTDIHNEGFYPEAYMGSAVYAEANASLDNLLLDGYSGNTATITVNNCDFGVYTHNIAAATQAVTMTNVGVGVYGEANTNLKNLTVANCTIHAVNQGVYFSSNPGAQALVVSHNVIYTSHPKGTCILSQEGATTPITNNLQILENYDIQCQGSVAGINVVGHDLPVIKWNNITSNQSAPVGFIGISLYNCGRADVSCNNIDGGGRTVTDESTSILIDQCYETRLHCNVVDNTTEGITFNGVCNGTSMADNEIQNHFEGLHLNGAAVITNQFHQGNRWMGNYSSGFGAVSLGNLTNNLFRVHTSQPSVFHPVNNSVGWFTINLIGVPYDCDNFDECNPDPLNRMLNTNLSLEQSIANGTFTTLDYVPESKNIAMQNLYAQLDKDVVMRNQNDDFQNFYSFYQNASIGKLEQITESVNALTYYDNLFTNALNAAKLTTETILDSLKELDSLRIVNSNDTLLDSLSISLKNQLNIAQQAIAQIVLQRELLITSDAAAAKNNNAIIVSTEIPEQNKRAVNAIYLETIGVGNFSLTPSQVSTLLPIAQQCPYSGGPSVYSARVLLKMAKLNLSYDDNPVCWSQGIYRLAATKKEEQHLENELAGSINFTVLPNPAKDFVNVYYNGTTSEKCILQITNSNGNEVVRVNLPTDKTMFIFRTDNFANGVYQVKFSTASSQMVRKLVIIK